MIYAIKAQSPIEVDDPAGRNGGRRPVSSHATSMKYVAITLPLSSYSMLPTLHLSLGFANACMQPWSYLDFLESTKSDEWHSNDILSHVCNFQESRACRNTTTAPAHEVSPKKRRSRRSRLLSAAVPLQQNGGCSFPRPGEYMRMFNAATNMYRSKEKVSAGEIKDWRVEGAQDEHVLPLLEIVNFSFLRLGC